MLTGTSTESAAAFAASYHCPPGTMLRRPRRRRQAKQRPVGLHTRERWAWFRIGVLVACRILPRTTSTLFERFGVDASKRSGRRGSAARVAWRNLALLVRSGFLKRAADGYLTIERGERVLGDLHAMRLDDAERGS